MKRTRGFWILAFLFFGLTLLFYGLSRTRMQEPRSTLSKISASGVATESNTVKKVIDGDTLTLVNGDKIRLIGINAPEINQPNFLAAKNKLESLVSGKTVRVAYDVEKKDQYGRTLAYLYIGDVFVNLELVKNGMAVVETIQPNSQHSDLFVKAQADARKNCLGMWDGLCHSDTSACIHLVSIHQSSSVSLNDEWVEILNTCSSSQNLQGYLLKDTSASNSYTFKNISVESKKSIKLHSGCSTDSTSDVYWQCPERTVPVWNNSGDSAYLYNTTGKLVSQMSY